MQGAQRRVEPLNPSPPVPGKALTLWLSFTNGNRDATAVALSNAQGPLAVCGVRFSSQGRAFDCPYYDGYTFFIGRDSTNEDIATTASLDEAAARCNKSPSCVAFNSERVIKSKAPVPPHDSISSSPCAGIYVNMAKGPSGGEAHLACMHARTHEAPYMATLCAARIVPRAQAPPREGALKVAP